MQLISSVVKDGTHRIDTLLTVLGRDVTEFTAQLDQAVSTIWIGAHLLECAEGRAPTIHCAITFPPRVSPRFIAANLSVEVSGARVTLRTGLPLRAMAFEPEAGSVDIADRFIRVVEETIQRKWAKNVGLSLGSALPAQITLERIEPP
jgi:hypothetical protein